MAETARFLFFSPELIQEFMETLSNLHLSQDILFKNHEEFIYEKNQRAWVNPPPVFQELEEHMCDSPCSVLLEFIQGIFSGRLLVYPTDTIYGLGTTIHSLEGTKKIFSIKRRPVKMPLSLCVPSERMIHLVAEPDERAQKLVRSFLPGPLTLVLKARDSFWENCDAAGFFVKDGKVGLRYLPDPFFNALLWFTGPISSTSANCHGKKEFFTLSDIITYFGDSVDYYSFWHSAHHAGQEESWMRPHAKNPEKGERYLYGDEKATIENSGCDENETIKTAPPPFPQNELHETRRRDRTMKSEEEKHNQLRSSTVVELCDHEIRILREGVISREAIEEKLHGP